MSSTAIKIQLSLGFHPYHNLYTLTGCMADAVHSCGGLRARGTLQAMAQLSRVHLVLRGALVSDIVRHQIPQHGKPAQERNLRCQPHLAHRRTRLDVRQLLLSGQLLFSIFVF